MPMTKIERAIARLLCNPRFLFENHVLSTMSIIEDKTGKHKTMATNGIDTVLYNAAFVEEIGVNCAVGVLVHETWHKCHQHVQRRGNRTHADLWNIAIDYEANAAVHELIDRISNRNVVDLPGQPISIDQYRGYLQTGKREVEPGVACYMHDPIMNTPDALTAEQIYDLLIPHVRDDGSTSGGAAVIMPGDVFGGDFDAAAASAALKEAEAKGISTTQVFADIDMTNLQAAQRAEKAGVGSVFAKLTIENAKTASVDWRRELRAWCRAHLARDDWSFRRPNRQAIVNDLVLPSMMSESTGRIVLAVDTSGSCLSYLPQFGAEMAALVKQLRPTELIVLYCDTEVVHVDRFKPTDKITFDAHGGGGTSFHAPFKWVVDNKITDVDAFVYLTDLYGSYPDRPPRFPVLWAVTEDSREKAAWGRQVPVRMEKQYA